MRKIHEFQKVIYNFEPISNSEILVGQNKKLTRFNLDTFKPVEDFENNYGLLLKVLRKDNEVALENFYRLRIAKLNSMAT